MFSLGICRYSIGILIIEVLKMVKNCDIYGPLRFRKKIFPWELGFGRLWKICPGGGVVTLGIN